MLSEYENSASGGYPVELFEFETGGVTYRYVHHDDEVQEGSRVWSPGMYSRSSFSKGTELDQSGITITLSDDAEILQLFSDGIPEDAVDLTVYRMHLTDPDLEKWVIWRGEVVSLKRPQNKVQLLCEPSEISLRSVGLRRRFQTTCPYPVYGEGCFIDRLDYEEDATVTSVSGTEVKVDKQDCSPFVGGMLYHTDQVSKRYRYIADISDYTIHITRPASWLIPSMAIKLYRGCNKTVEICRGIFDNMDNYGGMPHMPVTDLFNKKVF